MIANKRLLNITLNTKTDIFIVCLMIFGVVGSILDALGVITTQEGPKVISLVLAVASILHLFTANYFTKAKDEKDSARYNYYIVMLSIYCLVPAILIADLFPVDRDIKYGITLLISGFLYFFNWKIEKIRSK